MEKTIIKKAVLVKLIMTLFCIINVIISAFLLNDVFLFSNVLLYLSCVLLILIQITKKTGFCKFLILLNFIIFLLLVAYLLLDYFGLIDKMTDLSKIKDAILSAGKWGVIIYFIVTVLQVVILPLPAAVTIVLGVLIYGSLVAFVVSAIGTIVGSIICYAVGRFFGVKAVVWIAGRDKAEKFTRLLGKKGRLPFVVMLLFPFFPDDVLCMASGLVKMSLKFFIIAVSICRTLVIGFIAFFGNGDIIPFDGWGISVWLSFIAVLLFVVYLIILKIKKKSVK